MSLSLRAIDRLFDRLSLTYGRAFMAQWDGLPKEAEVDLKTLWAHELGAFANRLEAIAWALENLPEKAPNVLEFRNLCRRAPSAEPLPLPGPKPDPERVRAELAKLGAVLNRPNSGRPVDHKSWARGLVARAAAGDRVPLACLQMARDALGIPNPTKNTDEPDRAGAPA